ncbi:hypothetical protein HK097_002999 [Rhizophlyctis rosea]|uniref:Major capsid protein n=1 Tax=Rhizophlyctis rosea TaxID=64517 RepID=A0AAD5S315_9FUNG|nr:hypothetical protein HK097_002999 [Rhizophlyctis rosea]
MSAVALPQEFDFAPLPLNSVTAGNQEQWVSKPSDSGGGAPYYAGPSTTIQFTIASGDSVMRTNSSYLRFKVTPVDANNNPVFGSDCRITKTGLAAVIGRLTIQVGPTLVESIDLYGNSLLPLIYESSSNTKKDALQQFEGYGLTDLFTVNNGYYCYHPIQSTLFSTDQVFPLAALDGSVVITLYLNTPEAFFTSFGTAKPVAKFALEDVSFNYQLVVPNPRYTMEMRSGILSNKTLKVPYSRCKQMISYGSGGTENIVNVPVGPVESLNSLYLQMKSQADLTTQSVSTDKAIISKPFSLAKYYFTLGSQMVPQGRRFGYASPGSATGTDIEAAWLSIVSQTGAYDYDKDAKISAKFDTENFRLGVTLSGSSTNTFGAGYNLMGDSTCRVHMTFNNPLPTTTRIEATAFVDSYILIGNGFVQVIDRDLQH